MPWSAGFCLRNVGGVGMPAGNSGMTSAIAVWTSTAALSIRRARSNCNVTFALPAQDPGIHVVVVEYSGSEGVGDSTGISGFVVRDAANG